MSTQMGQASPPFDSDHRITHFPLRQRPARFRQKPSIKHKKFRKFMNIVVVDSPAKAKTINAYLGRGYEVLASFGHVRDLPPKDGSVDPDADFHMIWEIDPKSQKRVNSIADAVKGADTLILARSEEHTSELQ